MDRIEYVYTFGMTDDEVEDCLESTGTGVLALAADGDAYAFPVAHHYHDGSLFVRLSVDDSSTKTEYLEETDTACLTLYDVDSLGESWSVIVHGPLRKLSGAERFDEATINEVFLNLRIFDEDVESIRLEVHELEITSITGRKTGG